MGSIEERRSIRRFKDKAINRKTLEVILEAGLRAPSPKNRQPWRYVVILDRDMKMEIVDAMRREINMKMWENPDRGDISASLETMDAIEQAQVLVLVCYQWGMAKQHDDGIDWQISAKDLEVVELQAIGASVENMLLKAEELGIGSLWCADILYAYDIISKYSELPVVSAVCFGYKDEMPEERKRRAISELCVFYEREASLS